MDGYNKIGVGVKPKFGKIQSMKFVETESITCDGQRGCDLLSQPLFHAPMFATLMAVLTMGVYIGWIHSLFDKSPW